MDSLSTVTDLYDPLPPGHVRLLDFTNAQYQDGDISCSLFSACLDSAPDYAALSYAWKEEGESDPEGRLIVNGLAVEVQSNLYNAIRSLCNTMRADELMLWVDFICINQADLDERGHQVQLMRRIYEQATYVVAWLGLPHRDEQIQKAIEFMEFFTTVHNNHPGAEPLASF
ncbi:hypothetical protein M409DRAFT_20783 [Zasmidium cellare ATCC 36951]|uniref:Heterokaryon incompatibility domain-containing protein n=1 Tax=Zasmidium cellare ATCC 36951 TaxID=1080233 RepID=A0A6A6CTF7_ZASCE|nr:uncharacterized protein M409DRAFT_20783 [Zasmidium cellare ATCC 36951]KAF2168766.1 hypothetical protein M409DRAFT_20783 [Zasmidium cellare ATCC 36951]